MLEILTGVLQGLTEFLPISSSGHLVIISSLSSELDLNTNDIAFLHIGTLFSIVFFYRKRIFEIFEDLDTFVFYFKIILAGIIPAVLIGLLTPIQNIIDESPNLILITGASYLIFSLLLIFPSKINDLSVISMEYFVKQDEAVIWRGPMLHKAIEQFLYEVLWQDIDILLIDMPPGTGDVSISLSQFLNFYETIIVTTPQSNATTVAERAGIMSKKVNSSIIGVIENMSYLENGNEKLYPFG
ncbi:P-loop NTPase, partial [Acidimicrobiaceae bacterium]|nr:P-loop NTPase [Acidimicrobiaceae bacterium]